MTTATLSDQALQQAATLVRQGRYQDAIAAGEAALGQRSDPVLHALVGTVALRIGDFDRAAEHLHQTLSARPDDLTVRGNLAEALSTQGRFAELLDAVPAERAAADPSLRLWRYRGHAAQQLNRFTEARDAYSKVVAADPADWSSWNNLGTSLNALGEHEAAIAALRQALTLVPDSAPIQLNLSEVLIDSGDGAEAERVLLAMTEHFPDDPKPWTSLYNLYKLAGHEEPSLSALRNAVARDPADMALTADLAQEYGFRNQFDEAERLYDRVIAHQPTLFAAYQGLGSLLERTNREGELDALLEKARSAGAPEPEIGFVEALKRKREGRFEEALTALDGSAETVLPGRRAHVRGQLLDRLGRTDEAWDSFMEMNQYWIDDPGKPLDRAALYRAQVRTMSDLLTPEWAASWTRHDLPLDRPTPAFLVGFPRSGTTLLDTILMGHPGVQVLEEEPFIAEIEEQLGGPAAFPTVTREQVAKARDTYFERANSVAPLRPGTLLIDKQPLHLNKVPAILRLFPDARFILALRHPLDVLLSCLTTNFRPNHGMANFLVPELAAETYDLTFSTWEKSRAVFSPPVHTMVYEQMVDDPAAQLRPLVEWLGLSWQDELLDHQKTASSRGHISTASYAQVVEPIYTRSKGRWHRYARQLAPIIPVIRPWADKFGYSVEP
ncbi:sulfotransferase [Sphingomonas sp. KRR8]|uniref:tetratricopeptide repeat-containing sulfotransferase family protein n=1 Tax=Sphingomonas sp. KRR8 TaxID=2942996 RepID=UPI00202023EB|nr:tetratricopeptide repeat-containing sulfotransferase family protein [Sphingomonas sp. KRR8]URD60004.1 sulfotransferase [Sphingomonas sp. KRR8]